MKVNIRSNKDTGQGIIMALIDRHELQEINRKDLRVEFKLYQESNRLTNIEFTKRLKIKDHEFLSYKNRSVACEGVIDSIAGFFGYKAIHDEKYKPASKAIYFGKKSSLKAKKADPKACEHRNRIEQHQLNNEEKDLARLYR